jgi:hypothetical protein
MARHINESLFSTLYFNYTLESTDGPREEYGYLTTELNTLLDRARVSLKLFIKNVILLHYFTG